MRNDPRIAEERLRTLKYFICSRWKTIDSKIESGTFRHSSGESLYLRVFNINGAPLFDVNLYREGVEIIDISQNRVVIPNGSLLDICALGEKLLSSIQ